MNGISVRRLLATTAVAWAVAAVLPVPQLLAADHAGAASQPRSSRAPAGALVQALGTELGRLRIPAIGLDEGVRAGVSLSVIDRGVAHWVGTATPGDAGNVVLAGHRTTHTAPFLDLDRLATGDLVFMTDGTGFDVMYKVVETIVVEPEDIWITYDTGAPQLTMFACHPKGSARYRIVVRADLVAGRRIS